MKKEDAIKKQKEEDDPLKRKKIPGLQALIL